MMASYTGKSYNSSPEQFRRTKGGALTGSDRAASSSGDSDTGGNGGEFYPLISS